LLRGSCAHGFFPQNWRSFISLVHLPPHTSSLPLSYALLLAPKYVARMKRSGLPCAGPFFWVFPLIHPPPCPFPTQPFDRSFFPAPPLLVRGSHEQDSLFSPHVKTPTSPFVPGSPHLLRRTLRSPPVMFFPLCPEMEPVSRRHFFDHSDIFYRPLFLHLIIFTVETGSVVFFPHLFLSAPPQPPAQRPFALPDFCVGFPFSLSPPFPSSAGGRLFFFCALIRPHFTPPKLTPNHLF